MSKDVRDALQIAVSKVQTPAGQANAVIRALSVLRYNKAPKVSDGKLDGDNVRIYEWGSDSPAGRFYLITGSKFLPKIVEPSEIQVQGPGLYVLAGPTKSGAAKKAEEYAANWHPRVRQAVTPREKRAVKTLATETLRSAPAAPAPAGSSKDSEVAELKSMLAALLG